MGAEEGELGERIVLSGQALKRRGWTNRSPSGQAELKIESPNFVCQDTILQKENRRMDMGPGIPDFPEIPGETAQRKTKKSNQKK